METILIATHNKGKFIEIKENLKSLPVVFVSLSDLKIQKTAEENGKTYEENAKKKAEFFARISGLPTIADDSGIHVDALKGELQHKTRRWGMGESAGDKEWILHFLDRMKKEKNRSAEFICVVAFYNLKKTYIFRGKCEGTITYGLEAEYLPGLPLSSVFRPKGYEKVYSALKVSEKNKVSHRGRAIKDLKEFLYKKLTT